MIPNDLLNALQSAGEQVKKLHINKQIDLAEGATWLECTLDYGDDSFNVVFVIHADGTWFTPIDWQGAMPETVKDIPEFDWQVGCSGKPAIVLHGLPRAL